MTESPELYATAFTPIAKLPYPADLDAPDGPSQLHALASQLDPLLVPKVLTTADRDLIPSPPKGLLIYVGDIQRFQYFDGTWKDLGTAAGAGGYPSKAPGPRTDAVTHLMRNDDPGAAAPHYIVAAFDGSYFLVKAVNSSDVDSHEVRVGYADKAAKPLVTRDQSIQMDPIWQGGGFKLEWARVSNTNERFPAQTALADQLVISGTGTTFQWADPGDNPDYVWGAKGAQGLTRLYSPGRFNVATAGTAGSANDSANLGGIPAWRMVDKSADAGMNGIYYFQNTNHGFRYPGIQGTTSAANAYITGAPTRGLMIVTSSERFKDNIAESEVDWHPLLNLRPKRWRDKGDDVIWHGLIAEDVAEAVPEVAMHDSEGIVENYHTGSVIAGLISLLREAFDRIEALEAQAT